MIIKIILITKKDHVLSSYVDRNVAVCVDLNVNVNYIGS